MKIFHYQENSDLTQKLATVLEPIGTVEVRTLSTRDQCIGELLREKPQVVVIESGKVSGIDLYNSLRLLRSFFSLQVVLISDNPEKDQEEIRRSPELYGQEYRDYLLVGRDDSELETKIGTFFRGRC